MAHVLCNQAGIGVPRVEGPSAYDVKLEPFTILAETLSVSLL